MLLFTPKQEPKTEKENALRFVSYNSLCPCTSNDAELVICPTKQQTNANFFFLKWEQSEHVPCGWDLGLHPISWWQPPLSSILFSCSIYLTTDTTCFSFSDTTGTVPGLLCLRTFLSLEKQKKSRDWVRSAGENIQEGIKRRGRGRDQRAEKQKRLNMRLLN